MGTVLALQPREKPSRDAVFVALLRDLVETIDDLPAKPGRPPIPVQDRLFVAIQKVFTTKSQRGALGAHEYAIDRGTLTRKPYVNLSSRTMTDPAMTPILHELVALSALPTAPLEEHFAVDSTGFRTPTLAESGQMTLRKLKSIKARRGMRQSDERDYKGKEKLEHVAVKAHFCVGTRTHIITQVRVTELSGRGTGDTSQFAPLVRGTHASGFRIKSVAADKAYGNHPNYAVASEIGALAYLMFKKNAKDRKKGVPRYKEMFHKFSLEREAFMAAYHRRSNVESANSAIKRLFGRNLRSKKRVAWENEILCKVVAYNLTVLIGLMEELGVRLNGESAGQAARSPPQPASPARLILPNDGRCRYPDFRLLQQVWKESQ